MKISWVDRASKWNFQITSVKKPQSWQVRISIVMSVSCHVMLGIDSQSRQSLLQWFTNVVDCTGISLRGVPSRHCTIYTGGEKRSPEIIVRIICTGVVACGWSICGSDAKVHKSWRKKLGYLGSIVAENWKRYEKYHVFPLYSVSCIRFPLSSHSPTATDWQNKVRYLPRAT